ncbi:cupin domain-containing protein [Methylocystis bryophila]|uniref:Cupin n=1 Tax=Methylocystis bryophila TaxID=655015 RepID=A0A1W6MRJ5_9HYPH|nr:cupin domain-containing protein [Methylocystis bryophila]ARN80214.1 cupin [Methylocystis bryophila]BDV40168.1 cupin [Methylocystis bryophila]
MIAAEEVIRALSLKPHPEGGFFRETFRDEPRGERAASTAIYYLLPQGEISRWHRIDAAEIWHFYAGAPLELSLSEEGLEASRHLLGADLAAGERPQLVAPPGWWQSAKSLGAWTLVGCTVAPGFEFSRFELAPEGFDPDGLRLD